MAKTAVAPGDLAAVADAKKELDAFKTEVLEAANMFWALYGELLKAKPPALAKIDQLVPGVPAGAGV
jgi:hypothetical protein